MNSIVTTSEVRAAALRVAELGLRVHPLIGKRPIWEDWPSKATSERAAVERMMEPGRNYGIVCDRVAVIDTDTAELAQWWLENMPRTPWMVRTPRGGAHFYYRSVPGLRNATGVDRGWDVRAGGRGYAVGFGSCRAGTRYELIGAATLDLPPFDRAWLPVIRASPMPASLPAPSAAAVAAGRIRDLRAYIRRIKSIQGSRGSDACFRVACILRDAGLSPEESLAYLLEWNQSCADPPWSVTELEHKVRDAFAIVTKGG
jgi:hypothetical protein